MEPDFILLTDCVMLGPLEISDIRPQTLEQIRDRVSRPWLNADDILKQLGKLEPGDLFFSGGAALNYGNDGTDGCCRFVVFRFDLENSKESLQDKRFAELCWALWRPEDDAAGLVAQLDLITQPNVAEGALVIKQCLLQLG